ncbi:SDR family oxidoreductase [Mucilaginibacter sp. PAMB04274]|uniref:SDR family oxidoreductase n=1 Tax=Mucilaginibacter sp. PAMB04274 TaxID=3138568 RepID=UPI0031F707F9
MILVTGASGHFGSKAVEHLLKKGIDPQEITVLVRDLVKAEFLKEQGVKIKEGNYSDYNSMVEAFIGVDKLLLVSSNDREAIENRTQHHKNAIDAAREAGVKHIVYTSFVRKLGFEGSAIAGFQNSHVQSEEYLKQSGIAYTILQNGIYTEMILAFVGDKVAETGTFLFPAGNGKASWTLREELAEVAAHVLITGNHQNKTYTLTNTESVGFNAIAQCISEALDKKINYKSPDVNEFRSVLENSGVPGMYIDMFIMWSTGVAEGMMDLEDSTLASLLGRKPTSVSQFIGQVYH